ncbi:MAG: serine/threonine-protein kinase [Planctomycetota bacterium]
MDESKFEALCDRFEASWKAGTGLKIESFLDELPGGRDQLFAALLEIELEYRFRGPTHPNVAEYEARFPDHQKAVADSFAATRRRLQHSASGSLDETQVSDVGVAEPHARGLRRLGQYQVLKPVGVGRRGRVFEGRQVEPVNRRVALKVLQTEASSEEILSRIDAERSKLALVDHPHIASWLDAGITDSGDVYLVMEFVSGLTITRLCDRFSLSVKQRLQLFLQCCEAIQFAHEIGITHGDLRPNNVLVTQQNGVPVVKVVDLGLASILRTGVPVGDPTTARDSQVFDIASYMSPERLGVTNSKHDTQSDVYSLGVLLYELLTGTTPIEHPTVEGPSGRQLPDLRSCERLRPSVRLSGLEDRASIAARRKTDPVRLARLFEATLDPIVMKALEVEPDRRYRRVGEFAGAIERLLSGDEEEATRGPASPKPIAKRDIDAITIAGTAIDRPADFGPEAVSFDTILTPPQQADEIGRLGEFRALKLLGAGGMGFVFLAQHRSSDRHVALKVMKPAIELDPNAKQRFLREARAAKDLKHPNIVETLSVGDCNGNPYITMEYLRGQSLGAIVEQGKPIDEARFIQFAKGITAGLAFAHSRELVHRDIKPNNIWVCAPSNSIKILDFGLVRDVSRDHVSLTETGVVLGSPKYMSPEQTRGEKVGLESDLFSLGSILYRLATGHNAFDGKNITTTLLAIAKAEPTPVASLRPGLHPGISSLIHSLLQKAPQDRPASASDVHQSLVRLETQATSTRI